jgi:hypothetical protein
LQRILQMCLEGESRCPSDLPALVAKAADLFIAFEAGCDFHTRRTNS